MQSLIRIFVIDIIYTKMVDMASIYDKPDFGKLVMMSEIDALRHNIDYNIILIRAFHAMNHWKRWIYASLLFTFLLRKKSCHQRTYIK